MGTRTVSPPSRKCSLKNVLSDRAPNSSDLNSDYHSIVSTREESNYFLNSIHSNSSSSSENYDISSSTLSSFASEDDLTYSSSNDKINFDTLIFDNSSSSFARDSKLFKIDFDVEAFENHIVAEVCQLQDDFSNASRSSTTSKCSKFSCFNGIEEIIVNAS